MKNVFQTNDWIVLQFENFYDYKTYLSSEAHPVSKSLGAIQAVTVETSYVDLILGSQCLDAEIQPLDRFQFICSEQFPDLFDSIDFSEIKRKYSDRAVWINVSGTINWSEVFKSGKYLWVDINTLECDCLWVAISRDPNHVPINYQECFIERDQGVLPHTLSIFDAQYFRLENTTQMTKQKIQPTIEERYPFLKSLIPFLSGLI